MNVKLTKFGKAVGILIPGRLRRSMGFQPDQFVRIEKTGAGLLIRPLSRRRYTLQDLIAQCDPSAPMPTVLTEWDQ